MLTEIVDLENGKECGYRISVALNNIYYYYYYYYVVVVVIIVVLLSCKTYATQNIWKNRIRI